MVNPNWNQLPLNHRIMDSQHGVIKKMVIQHKYGWLLLWAWGLWAFLLQVEGVVYTDDDCPSGMLKQFL